MATYLLIDALEFSIDVLARRGNQTDGFFPYAKNLYTNFKVSMAESLFFPRFDLVFPVFFRVWEFCSYTQSFHRSRFVIISDEFCFYYCSAHQGSKRGCAPRESCI